MESDLQSVGTRLVSCWCGRIPVSESRVRVVRIMKNQRGAQQPFQSFDVNDVHIGYNPALQAPGSPAPQSLTFDFETKTGWVRVRLEGSVCRLFDGRYREHTEGRLK